ncbi:MAG: class I SAM-dependent methyltransferase [Arcobacteraceae bacterium]|nr:class I SAM-dependent methyltransferase [Arcobacteraceae bacterium]
MENENYEQWKDWDKNNFAITSNHERAYFNEILKSFNLNDKINILEIGFGNGSFLGFANEQGWNVTGIEVIPELLKRAKDNGFEVFNNIEEITTDNQFDLIVMFDVLEHIEQDKIIYFFNLLSKYLDDKGSIILRVPNGTSPFGLSNQYGDVTHCTVVTDAKLNYWTKYSKLYVNYINGDIYPFIYKHNLKKAFSKILKHILHAISEKIVRWVYAPQPKGVLSSNLFAILKKYKEEK